ncbi:hypothetical protein MFUL124B02_19810 [Myxococcus fulvus 124B02]|nr:hypothetical protein MFUL124B02_19810 [Myxococcus fulvus 124B02]
MIRGMLLVFGLLVTGCGGMAEESDDNSTLATQADSLRPACQGQAYMRTFYDGPEMRRSVGVWTCRCGAPSATMIGYATHYFEEERFVCR